MISLKPGAVSGGHNKGAILVDEQCRALATEILTLDGKLEAARSVIRGRAPAARWMHGFTDAVVLSRALGEAVDRLQACVDAHPSPVEVEVDVFDITGSDPRQRSVTLWSLTAAVATRIETSPLWHGRANLAAPPTNGLIGLTVEPTAPASRDAADARSGWLERFPWRGIADPNVRLECAVAAPLTFGPRDLDEWLSAGNVQSTSVPIGAMGVTATATLEQATLELAPPIVRLRSAGTIRVNTSGTSQVAAYSGTVPLSLELAPGPDSASLTVSVAGETEVALTGPLASMLTAIVPFLVDFVGRQAATSLAAAVNGSLPAAVAKLFGLEEPPADATVSLRSVMVDTNGITVEPGLTAFGSVLSRYVR